jgi:glycosyltransferase involved in cell wall biosynthesis
MRTVPRAVLIRFGFASAACLVWLGLPIRMLRRHFQDAPRSVWSGTPILTLAIKARAERTLGYRAVSVVTHAYHTSSAFDRDLSRWRRLPLIGHAVPFVLFVWACLAADRLHFFCDRGILPSARRMRPNYDELALYRRLGIELFFWTYGADVRSRDATQDLGEPNCCTDCTLIGKACICHEAERREAMASLTRYATAIFAMGDMIEYTPGSRNDLYFWPIDLAADGGRRFRPAYPDGDASRPLRITHAANHRMFKGTRFLEEAVQALREEGELIELVLVGRLGNLEALELYRAADVIFDQCLIGFHGYFALEAMALGKPVLCYIRKRDYLLAPDECPIINVRAATLKDDLRRLLRQRERLNELGRAGRAYVEKYFTPEAFARRLEHAYRDIGVTACARS